MARQKGIDQKIQVTRGFVTEYTPAAFPQEAAIDLDNVIIDSDGSVRRRPGLDVEQQFLLAPVNGVSLSQTQVDEQAMSQHLWEAVGNSGTLNIVVFQIGAVVQFYAQVGALSANFLGETNLATFAVGSGIQTAKMEMSSGLGDLYIVSKFLLPLRISYDGTTFTVETIDLRIRDFEGLDDELEIDRRPTTLTRSHYYNLRNQGWTDKNIRVFANLGSGASLTSGPFSALGFPSNSDIMSTGIVTNASGDLEFDPDFIKESFLGNTPAPKGHFILDAFDKDYDEALGAPGTGNAIILARPASVAFHQGRAWFSAPTAQNAVGGVFYSQQLVNKDRIGNCFQEADPTADEINDLVNTDGGFLPMPGIGAIIALVEFNKGVVVLASNGVWYIASAEGGALTATSVSLLQVTSVGALGSGSVVVAGDALLYWGIDGIIELRANQFGELKPNNIAEQTIQTFYINISADARKDAIGVYIPEQQKVFWAYKAAGASETISAKSFDSLLVLDAKIKGFYKYSIGQSATQLYPLIVGLSLVKPLGESTNLEAVTDISGTVVVDTLGDPVTSSVFSTLGQITQLKLAVMVYSTTHSGYRATFATFHSRSFTDWKDIDNDGKGIPMSSFIEFAEFNMGALHTKGRPTYVHSFYQKTSKNLQAGGYYELPPLYYKSIGLRVSQSCLEVLNRPSSNLRVSQSALETLYTAPSDLLIAQMIVEIIDQPLPPASAETSDLHADLYNGQVAIDAMGDPTLPVPDFSDIDNTGQLKAQELVLYNLWANLVNEHRTKYIDAGGNPADVKLRDLAVPPACDLGE